MSISWVASVSRVASVSQAAETVQTGPMSARPGSESVSRVSLRRANLTLFSSVVSVSCASSVSRVSARQLVRKASTSLINASQVHAVRVSVSRTIRPSPNPNLAAKWQALHCTGPLRDCASVCSLFLLLLFLPQPFSTVPLCHFCYLDVRYLLAPYFFLHKPSPSLQ